MLQANSSGYRLDEVVGLALAQTWDPFLLNMHGSVAKG